MDPSIITDIEAIRTVKAAYGELSDRIAAGAEAGDIAALRNLMADDVEFQFGHEADAPRVNGIAPALAHFTQALPTAIQWMWHGFHAPIIAVDGDAATGRWAFHAYSVAADDPLGAPSLTVGRTVDEYVRSASGWKLRRMEARFNGQWPLAVRS